jgi:hypothetical protein
MQAMNPGQMLEVRRGEGPRSKGSQGQLAGSRDVPLFEIGDGKRTLLRFDYDHPPKAQAEPALVPGQGRVQQDLLAFRSARALLGHPR